MQSYAVNAFVIQLLSLLSFNGGISFGLAITVLVYSSFIVYAIVCLLHKTTPTRFKIGKGILIGTFFSLVLIGSIVYWFSRSFSR